jgi:hypothetical protein
MVCIHVLLLLKWDAWVLFEVLRGPCNDDPCRKILAIVLDRGDPTAIPDVGLQNLPLYWK